MAIATLKKIDIIGHSSERDRVLEFLQGEGNVEVIDLTDKSNEYKDFSFEQHSVRYEDVSEAVEKLSWVMSFLEGLGEKKRSPLAAKSVLRRGELRGLLKDFDYRALYKRCREIESSLKKIEKKRIELQSRSKELLPWLTLDVPLDALEGTELTASALGSVRKKSFPPLRKSLESLPYVHLEMVCEDRANVYLFVAYLRSVEEEVAELLRQHEFAFHHLPRGDRRRAQETLQEIAVEEERLESERLAHLEQAKNLFSEETKVAALLDYFSNLETKEGAKERLLYSSETFFLQGWIKAGDATAAETKLQTRFDTVGVYLSDPSPDDVMPIVLENKEVVQPFEFLTGIYGHPAYRDVDPTPFLAPFFFLFFGYCLGDAVYGLILVLAAVFALKKFEMGPQGTRFFRLLFYCGVSTIIIGALTGGWLGDLLGIPHILVNPQEKPTAVLNVALILGIINVWTGYAVAAYGNIRRRQYIAAFLDQAPVFLLLAGLTGIGLIFLKTLSPEHTKLCLGLVGVGAVIMLASHGRHEPSLGGKLGFGVLAVYTTTTGYLSDILSYSRLWALGLVTAAMASTVNLIAATMGKLIPVVGIVFAVFIIIGGHLLTLMVNTLGAFVHPIRLVFVEFFSKFFRGTGRPFQPLAIENRFTVIEE